MEWEISETSVVRNICRTQIIRWLVVFIKQFFFSLFKYISSSELVRKWRDLWPAWFYFLLPIDVNAFHDICSRMRWAYRTTPPRYHKSCMTKPLNYLSKSWWINIKLTQTHQKTNTSHSWNCLWNLQQVGRRLEYSLKIRIVPISAWFWREVVFIIS